jgi:hypothetical protein
LLLAHPKHFGAAQQFLLLNFERSVGLPDKKFGDILDLTFFQRLCQLASDSGFRQIRSFMSVLSASKHFKLKNFGGKTAFVGISALRLVYNFVPKFFMFSALKMWSSVRLSFSISEVEVDFPRWQIKCQSSWLSNVTNILLFLALAIFLLLSVATGDENVVKFSNVFS